jgi:P63C domain-containing protein
MPSNPDLSVLFGDPSHPVMFGGIPIHCYVLSDHRRVITLNGALSAMGLQKWGGKQGGEQLNQLARFSSGNAVRQHVAGGVRNFLNTPLEFQLPNNGGVAYGFEAKTIILLCQAVVAARKGNTLKSTQLHIAERCEEIILACAILGVESLIDEATGYQSHRAQDALQKRFDDLIAKDLRNWIKTFQESFWQQLCRLRGVDYTLGMNRPSYFGHLINDIVYARLAPGVLRVVKRRASARGVKFHQWLTEQKGYPMLMDLLGELTGMMRLSQTWPEFMSHLNRHYPPYTLERGLFDALPGY